MRNTSLAAVVGGFRPGPLFLAFAAVFIRSAVGRVLAAVALLLVFGHADSLLVGCRFLF